MYASNNDDRDLKNFQKQLAEVVANQNIVNAKLVTFAQDKARKLERFHQEQEAEHKRFQEQMKRKEDQFEASLNRDEDTIKAEQARLNRQKAEKEGLIKNRISILDTQAKRAA